MFADLNSVDVSHLRKVSVEDLLLPVLVQLVVIIASARVAGVIARKFWQPSVVGEIVAGLMLGPSLLGLIFPELFSTIFHPKLHDVSQELSNVALGKIFQVLKEIGLIFLLFIIGLEFDFSHMRIRGQTAATVTFIGMALPFALGFGIAHVIHPYLEPHPTAGTVSLTAMTLFLGTALSITALPVLGRLMVEMGIQRTQLATVVIAAAATGDAIGWILLATVAAYANAAFSWMATLSMIGMTIGFFAVMFFVVRPLLIGYFRRSFESNNGRFSVNAFAVLLVALLLASIATNLIGIFAIFGAFILGAILSDQEKLCEAVWNRLRDFVTVFFVPIFFTYTGIRTELTSLNDPNLWWIGTIVVTAAIAAKILGCGLAARLTGFSTREASLIGILMNTRGLMELIVINVGYDLGVIPRSLFCILVLMAVITTAMTSPLVLLLRRGTELAKPIADSGFVGK